MTGTQSYSISSPSSTQTQLSNFWNIQQNTLENSKSISPAQYQSHMTINTIWYGPLNIPVEGAVAPKSQRTFSFLENQTPEHNKTNIEHYMTRVLTDKPL